MATTHVIGLHRVIVDGDWVELHLDGPLDAAASRAMHAVLLAVLEGNDRRAFVLADITRLEALHADARRDMAAWNREHKITAAAVFGGSFAMRTIVTLALKAIKFRDRDQVEVLFAKHEQEARGWLQAERARLPEARA